MKYKLELDFEIWKVFLFSLSALAMATAIGYLSLKATQSPEAIGIERMSIVFCVFLIPVAASFLLTYTQLRKKLED